MYEYSVRLFWIRCLNIFSLRSRNIDLPALDVLGKRRAGQILGRIGRRRKI